MRSCSIRRRPTGWWARSPDRALVWNTRGVTADEPGEAADGAGVTAAAPAARPQPEPERRRAERPPGVTIEVRPGETLSAIAVRLGVPVATLLEHNEGLNPNRVRAGQRLFVPEARPAVDLEVQRGDSLARIAARHEVTVSEILRWNPSVRRNGLREPKALRSPSGSTLPR